MLTSSQVLERARSACGKQITYRLGHGGDDPKAALPCDSGNECDCSGFALWALGVSRTVRLSHPWRDLFPPIKGQPYGIDTTRIVEDATGPEKAFRKVDIPEPGDFIVYGDGGGHEGHIGIVSAVHEGHPTNVVHCSAGNMRSLGDAIAETTTLPFWFTRGAIYARPKMYDGSPGGVGAPQDEGFA